MFLDLSENQKRNLSKGKNVQVRHEQMNCGDTDISQHLEAKHYKKLVRAYEKGRGHRLNGGNLLGQIYLGAKKMGLSKGDVNAVGRYFQPVSRAFLKSSQTGLTQLASAAPQAIAQNAMAGLSGGPSAGAPASVAGAGFRGGGFRGGSANPYMPTHLKGGNLVSTIQRKTGLSKGDMGAIGRYAQPISRAFLRSSQDGLKAVGERIPQIATAKAMGALGGAGIYGGKVYTDSKDVMRHDVQSFYGPIPVNPEFVRNLSIAYKKR
jgi:hypothetical protein